jgi:hypothetical protein
MKAVLQLIAHALMVIVTKDRDVLEFMTGKQKADLIA